MEKLEATSVNVKILRHAGLSPDLKCQFNYSVIESRNGLQFKGFSALTIGLDAREQKRRAF